MHHVEALPAYPGACPVEKCAAEPSLGYGKTAGTKGAASIIFANFRALNKEI
jgi:hypothetical protein